MRKKKSKDKPIVIDQFSLNSQRVLNQVKNWMTVLQENGVKPEWEVCSNVLEAVMYIYEIDQPHDPEEEDDDPDLDDEEAIETYKETCKKQKKRKRK